MFQLSKNIRTDFLRQYFQSDFKLKLGDIWDTLKFLQYDVITSLFTFDVLLFIASVKEPFMFLFS